VAEIRVYDNPVALAEAAAAHFVESAAQALTTSRVGRALSGGATPEPAYQTPGRADFAAASIGRACISSGAIERCVPPTMPTAITAWRARRCWTIFPCHLPTSTGCAANLTLSRRPPAIKPNWSALWGRLPALRPGLAGPRRRRSHRLPVSEHRRPARGQPFGRPQLGRQAPNLAHHAHSARAQPGGRGGLSRGGQPQARF